jgi:hypothetical protein
MSMHAAIWIDHEEARIFDIPKKLNEWTSPAPRRDVHKHPKGPEGAKEHPDDAKWFFDQVARSLDGIDEVFVFGPSAAMLEFFRYVHGHNRALEPKIVGIETARHPTDRQIVASATEHFKLGDSMRSQ